MQYIPTADDFDHFLRQGWHPNEVSRVIGIDRHDARAGLAAAKQRAEGTDSDRAPLWGVGGAIEQFPKEAKRIENRVSRVLGGRERFRLAQASA